MLVDILLDSSLLGFLSNKGLRFLGNVDGLCSIHCSKRGSKLTAIPLRLRTATVAAKIEQQRINENALAER